VPKHFFVPEIIHARPPLSPNARRAGWRGSNILIGKVPDAGRIFVLRNGVPEPKDDVLAKWKSTLFLKRTSIEARGWLIEVMKVVDALGQSEFDLSDVYAFEQRLSVIYPGNNNVKPKIRQQLQVLRDNGYLEFLGNGRYRLRRGDL
jgi:type II restriction enzyme